MKKTIFEFSKIQVVKQGKFKLPCAQIAWNQVIVHRVVIASVIYIATVYYNAIREDWCVAVNV